MFIEDADGHSGIDKNIDSQIAPEKFMAGKRNAVGDVEIIESTVRVIPSPCVQCIWPVRPVYRIGDIAHTQRYVGDEIFPVQDVA